MNDDARMREHLSALADGELQGEAFAQAVAYAATEEGESAWRIYHLIGDTLRSSEVTHVADPAFLGRLREQLALEPRHGAVAMAQPLVQVAPAPHETAPHAPDAAANVSVFRWKLAAGFASLAAVAALGWNAYLGLGGTAPQGAQLAAAQPPAEAAAPAFVATAGGPQGQQIMIRDPRLDELLAAHKQFGSTSALQMPAGFLRNATFEAPAR
ncbi:sigma-E factor negative regulatory protein [Alicycliphilus denitrificans]|uniref:sigma-E factor negative regulatory protein n=1 Tax=Alicycliphilus denitrificans TaxID=179636 RepID=UPI001F2FF7FA|nr:sigma-E factor negative regulatory protein [Alicycliphilus denitrificans]